MVHDAEIGAVFELALYGFAFVVGVAWVVLACFEWLKKRSRKS